MPRLPLLVPPSHPAPPRQTRNLSDVERRALYERLLQLSENGSLPPGALRRIALEYKCNRSTAFRVWQRGQASTTSGHLMADVASKIKGNSGRKKTRTAHEIEAAVKSVPQHDRQTLRSLAANSHVPKTTLVRHIKAEARLRARSSYVKPLLTEVNMVARLEHCLRFLRVMPGGGHVFENMHDYVHVDEKWFFLTKVHRRFYVYDDEEIALRSVKSKRFITKVMFLAAVARPRYDYHTKNQFDGKIGVWPFVEHTVAKRSSKNRPRGAPVITPQTVDSVVYQAAIVDKVAPAIMAKFPRTSQGSEIYIQQDNASPHRCVTTAHMLSKGVQGISIANQPPNSPDFNVLDLGFFNSIQSLQYQKCTRTIEELIGAVESAFYELPSATLSKTFITLQKVMELSMGVRGSNAYKLPHMNKDATIENLSGFNVECDPTSYESALIHLNNRLAEEASMDAQLNSHT